MERDFCEMSDEHSGEVPEPYSSDNRVLPFSDDNAQEAMVAYANSNNAWLEAFSAVFRTMITVGYDNNELCRLGTSEAGKDYVAPQKTLRDWFTFHVM